MRIGDQYLVQYVDHPVAGLYVYGDDADSSIAGSVGYIGDVFACARQVNGNHITFEGRWHNPVGEIFGAHIAGYHVVQQHLGEHTFFRYGCQGVKSRIGRGKYRESRIQAILVAAFGPGEDSGEVGTLGLAQSAHLPAC